jgi:hypothetical protein
MVQDISQKQFLKGDCLNLKVSIEYNSNQDLKLKVFNMAGQCILQDELDDKLTEIDIQCLSQGIYVIQISGEDLKIRKKLIME